MFAIPLCDWCGEHEVGSISGGSDRFCSTDCEDCFNESLDDFEAEMEREQAEADYKAEMANERWFEDRGGTFWDDPRGQ